MVASTVWSPTVAGVDLKGATALPPARRTATPAARTMPKSRGGGRSSGSSRYSPTGLYTSSGQPIRNADAYAATGAPTFSSSGGFVGRPSAYSSAVQGRISQNTDSPKHLYHYTSTSSADKIQSSGYIKPSTSAGDCRLGEGAYFTAKQPRSSDAGLLANNYGRSTSSRADDTRAYVRVDAEKVSAINGRAELGRDVWSVPGGVDLSGANAKFGTR